MAVIDASILRELGMRALSRVGVPVADEIWKNLHIRAGSEAAA